MHSERCFHTAFRLTNGKVLVAGNFRDERCSSNSTELYDPSAEMWTTTGRMNFVRSLPTASVLTNGKVLVTGGIGSPTAILNTAELYDPATGN